MKLQTNTFQPQQNENRSPSPMGGLFKKCSVTDMSSKIPGVSFLRHWQVIPYFETNLLCPFLVVIEIATRDNNKSFVSVFAW